MWTLVTAAPAVDPVGRLRFCFARRPDREVEHKPADNHAHPVKAPAAPQAARALPRQRHRKVKKVAVPRIEAAALDGLQQINLRAAGIDVGSQENYGAVPAHTVPAGAATVRAFGVFTADQDATVA